MDLLDWFKNKSDVIDRDIDTYIKIACDKI